MIRLRLIHEKHIPNYCDRVIAVTLDRYDAHIQLLDYGQTYAMCKCGKIIDAYDLYIRNHNMGSI